MSSDLVKRLDQALHFEDWMPVPDNFSESVPLLRESRNRIEELEAKLAKAVAELRKLGEAGKAHGYGSSYIICHNCSDTHHAVDAILAALKGQDDE